MQQAQQRVHMVTVEEKKEREQVHMHVSVGVSSSSTQTSPVILFSCTGCAAGPRGVSSSAQRRHRSSCMMWMQRGATSMYETMRAFAAVHRFDSLAAQTNPMLCCKHVLVVPYHPLRANHQHVL
jgi:hypothetical protein